MNRIARYTLWVSVLILPAGLLIWLLVGMVGGWVTAKRTLP